MRQITIDIKGKKYESSIPSGWGDMDDKHFIALLHLVLDDTDVDSLSEYFGMPKSVLNKIDMYTAYTLGTLIPQLKEDTALNHFIIPEIVSNKNQKFVSPASELYNMTFQQFITIDTFYIWCSQTKNWDYKKKMAEVMYMKEGETLDDVDIDVRDKEWNHVPLIYFDALFVNWVMIKNWLSGCYPHLFPRGGGEEKPTNGKVKMSNTWSEIMDALVGDDLTRIESYRKLQCMDVLRILNRRIKEQRENRFKK